MWMTKGFNEDMTCRGFQFKEGETYKEDSAQLCVSGFHACEYPLGCFNYYDPSRSVYHEVELNEVTERDLTHTKRAGKEITIDRRLSLKDMIQNSFKWLRKVAPDDVRCDHILSYAHIGKSESAAEVRNNLSVASATGANSVARAAAMGCVAACTSMASGALTEEQQSVAVTTYDNSASVADGEFSAAVAVGEFSAAVSNKMYSVACTINNRGTARANAFNSVALSTGTYSRASVEGESSVAINLGMFGLARGEIGSWLVLAEREREDPYEIKNMKCVQVDGINILPDVWYKLEDGEVVVGEVLP